MTTVLFYLVIAAVIGLVVFFLAVLVFGRGEQMAPLDPRTSPAELPDHDINSEDVRKIRFALALRGYRMSDVDWTLERLSEQIDSLRLENAQLRGQLDLPEQLGPVEPHDLSEDREEPDGREGSERRELFDGRELPERREVFDGRELPERREGFDGREVPGAAPDAAGADLFERQTEPAVER